MQCLGEYVMPMKNYQIIVKIWTKYVKTANVILIIWKARKKNFIFSCEKCEKKDSNIVKLFEVKRYKVNYEFANIYQWISLRS